MRANLSADGQTVRFRTGQWGEAFPADRIGDKLKFYRGLRDRANGRYAKFYEPAVKCLERVQTQIDGLSA